MNSSFTKSLKGKGISGHVSSIKRKNKNFKKIISKTLINNCFNFNKFQYYYYSVISSLLVINTTIARYKFPILISIIRGLLVLGFSDIKSKKFMVGNNNNFNSLIISYTNRLKNIVVNIILLKSLSYSPVYVYNLSFCFHECKNGIYLIN